MAFLSSNLSTVECDGRIPEGAPSQDRPSIGSRSTDDKKSSKTDIVFEDNLGDIGSDRIIERNDADEMRDQIVIEAAKEQAMESTGCIIS